MTQDHENPAANRPDSSADSSVNSSSASSAASPAEVKTLVPCPTCRRMTVYTTTNRWRPFCSERCRMIDLGAWAQEDYRMAARPEDEGQGLDE